MLAELDSGQPFSMTFITADRRRGTGGEIIRVRNWAKCQQQTATPELSILPTSTGQGKKPNHYFNKTRNIFNLREPRTTRKVHIRLICEFNGKQVI